MKIVQFLYAMLRFILTGKTLPDHVVEERLATCGACPFLLEGSCQQCGCRVDWKATMSTEDCPEKKW